MLPKITFGFVNADRLFYLKSCIETLLICTNDYSNKELIVIDNCSSEEGTQDYLDILKDRGIKVIRQEKKDPSNEFARALNLIFENSTGDFIAPLQGDSQFILQHRWLESYVSFYQENLDKVGCMIFDAQRSVTNRSHQYSTPMGSSSYKFVFDYNRPPIAGAGDVLYSRKILEKIYPWHINNIDHEGGNDSETHMLTKIRQLSMHDSFVKNLRCAIPIIPPSCIIYNSQGTNARVRKNKRYGEYFAPKDGIKYYEIKQYKDYNHIFAKIPFGIEDVVSPIGFKLLLDEKGSLVKNPIRPETATSDQFKVLYEDKNQDVEQKDDEYLRQWVNDL